MKSCRRVQEALVNRAMKYASYRPAIYICMLFIYTLIVRYRSVHIGYNVLLSVSMFYVARCL